MGIQVLFHTSVITFGSNAQPICVFLYWINLFCYSGDTDAVIPVTSTRYSIDALNLTTISPWRAWYEDGQVIPSIMNKNIHANSGSCYLGMDSI